MLARRRHRQTPPPRAPLRGGFHEMPCARPARRWSRATCAHPEASTLRPPHRRRTPRACARALRGRDSRCRDAGSSTTSPADADRGPPRYRASGMLVGSWRTRLSPRCSMPLYQTSRPHGLRTVTGKSWAGAGIGGDWRVGGGDGPIIVGTLTGRPSADESALFWLRVVHAPLWHPSREQLPRS